MKSKKNMKQSKKRSKKSLPDIEPGASIPIIMDKTKRKRCPNGSRFDKIAQQCMKFSKIKVFHELSEQKISETGTTVSIESLNKDGAVIKMYNNGNILDQKYVSQDGLEKAKEKGKKDIQKIIKTIRKVNRDPGRIQKDTGYQKLKRKMQRELRKRKGGDYKGNNEGIENPQIQNTHILIQSDVMDKLEDKRVEKEQDKLSREDNLGNQWYNGGMAIFNLLGSLFYSAELTTEVIEKWITGISHTFSGPFWTSQTVSVGNILNDANVNMPQLGSTFSLGFDMVGLLVLTIINIVAMIYPGDNIEIFVNIAQYVIYTSCLIFGGPLLVLGNWWIYMGLASTVIKSVFITMKRVDLTNQEGVIQALEMN